MADFARGIQRLGPQRGCARAHICLRILVFVPQLAVQAILARRLLLAPCAGVRPRQPVMHAIIARLQLGGALQPLVPSSTLPEEMYATPKWNAVSGNGEFSTTEPS